jgi:MFS family permease
LIRALAFRLKLDGWLATLGATRGLMSLNFMTYAACLTVLRTEWDMSATAAGSISTGFQLGYGASLLICSWLADRVGARRVFVVSCCLSAATAVAFALFARSYASGLVLFTLVAISQGGTYSTAIMLTADRYGPERRGAAVGWLLASPSLGYAISLGVSGITLPIGGYQLAFIVTGCGPLIGAIFGLSAMRAARNVVHSRDDAPGFATEVLRNRTAMRLTVAYTFHSWELLGMWAWGPAFFAASLAASGAASLQAVEAGAFLTASFHVVGLLAASTMGRLSDRLGRRTVLFTLAAASTACSLSIGWMVAWPIWIVAVVGAVYAFTALGDSPVLSVALTEAVRPAYLGAALAMRSLTGFGAGALAPLVFGAVLDAATGTVWEASRWGWAFVTFGAGGLIATIAAYGLPARHPSDKSAAKPR